MPSVSPVRPFVDIRTCRRPQALPEVDAVIVTAFVTNYEKCATEAQACRFNLMNVSHFIELLLLSSYRVVFVSSNAVFSSKSFFPTEDATPEPANPYGEQKLKVERRVVRFAREHKNLA